ncbi:S-adenosyl-L-methionine-dependent methyltransferase [Radiomyces spectabilis]|uniref:S-adenosyl-L-methionine-dependent methyltransferase n=1 Tax=Radiomyces spectabilis TaxID=64574 RepID=UPI00221EFB30|nr:S-adenosyl-L-methionine-dependent methyltransferase [Radiomyces spectabilis]KAI8388736.1 S-adenosyl-L-methionine-dependent methyltransferase [Radiomyces spectabilis]
MLMRVICHGNVPRNLLSLLPDIETPSSVISADHNGDSEEELPPEYVNTRRNAKLMLKSLDIVSVTRSNDADYLTTLDLHLRTPLSSVGLRSLFFHHTSHPIVGSSTYTKYLKSNRDKGLCASLIRIEFTHPVTGELLCLEGQEPEKFELIRKREQKFWQRKVDQAVAAMRKAGIKVNGTEGLDEIETGNTKKPLAYILGEKEFYRLNFKVSEECLIPRPSTETLVDAALMALKDRSAEKGCRILDIGTGCGNLLLAILSNTPNATGVGIDVSSGALNLAETNAKMLGIDNRAQFIKQDMAQLGSDVDENMLYDIIVCNPPYLDVDYISTKQQNQMSVLKYEPSEALFANDEGYEWYMILSKVIPLVARPGSRVILECGKGMMDRVKAIWADWKVVDILKDKQGWDRCLILTKE